MTITDDADKLSWTPLGQRLGFTSRQQQRDEILGGIECMAWTEAPAHPPYLDGPAVRAIAAAVINRRHGQIQFVGVAQLNGGRQLIGLQDARGGRSYVLDLDAEAIHVLSELPDLPTVVRDTRHVPCHSDFGGCDPCGAVDAEPVR